MRVCSIGPSEAYRQAHPQEDDLYFLGIEYEDGSVKAVTKNGQAITTVFIPSPGSPSDPPYYFAPVPATESSRFIDTENARPGGYELVESEGTWEVVEVGEYDELFVCGVDSMIEIGQTTDYVQVVEYNAQYDDIIRQ